MTAIGHQQPASNLEDVLVVIEEGAAHLEAPPKAFTLLDHGLQCAAALAEERPEDLELQAAGLLHDIGHTLLPGEPALHGEVAARFLRPLLGERVAELVRLHVDAKRYLVAVEPSYRDQLSMGSAETLIAQGEAMTSGEVETFEATPHSSDAVVLRRADEGGKVPGRPVPSLEEWVPVLRQLCDAAANSGATNSNEHAS